MINWIWGYVKRHPILTMVSYAVLAVPTTFILPIVGISALSIGIAAGVWGGVSFLISGCLGCVAEQYSAYQIVVDEIKSDNNELGKDLNYLERHPEDVQHLASSRYFYPGDIKRIIFGCRALEEKNCLNCQSKDFLMSNHRIADCLSRCIIKLDEAGFGGEEIQQYKHLFYKGEGFLGTRDEIASIDHICSVLCAYRERFEEVPKILLFSRHIKPFFHLICKPGRSIQDVVTAIRGLSYLYELFKPTEMTGFLARQPKCQVIQGFYFFWEAMPSDDLLKVLYECLTENHMPGLFEKVGQALYDLHQDNVNCMLENQGDLMEIIIAYKNIDKDYISRVKEREASDPVFRENLQKSPFKNNPVLLQILENINIGIFKTCFDVMNYNSEPRKGLLPSNQMHQDFKFVFIGDNNAKFDIERGKLYITKKDNQFYYAVVTHNGEVVENQPLSDIAIPEAGEFDIQLKTLILRQTSKAGHTIGHHDIRPHITSQYGLVDQIQHFIFGDGKPKKRIITQSAGADKICRPD